MQNRLTHIYLILLFIPSSTNGSEFVHIVTASPHGKELTRDGKTVVDLDGDRGLGQPTAQGGLWSEADGFHTEVPLSIDAYSKDGSTLVGSLVVDGMRESTAIWREASGTRVLSTARSAIRDMAADDSTFVGWLDEIPTIWQQDKPVPLSATDADWRYGSGSIQVSDDGRFVVFMAGPTNDSVSLKGWTRDEGLFDLSVSPPDGFRAGAMMMSAAGNVIMGDWRNLDDQYSARLWRWTPDEGVTELGPLPMVDHKYSSVLDISADGETMVGLFGPDSWGDWENNRAFIWDTQHGVRDLEQVLVDEYGFRPGNEVRMEHATGISDDRKTLLTYRRDNHFWGPWRLLKLDWPIGPPTADGNMNFDDVVDASDIDLQMEAIRQYPKANFHDLDFSGQVNGDDLTHLVNKTLNTWIGDANLDGEFNSTDLVDIFQSGEYEDGIAGNSGWAEGDWNADGDFTTSDLTVAFQDGGYDMGSRAAAAVPEPGSGIAVLFSLALLLFLRTPVRRSNGNR